MSSNNQKLNSVNWEDILEYDESVFTCIKWKMGRKVRGGNLVPRKDNHRAGSLTKEGYLVLGINSTLFSVPKIVWVLHNKVLPDGYSVYFKDGNQQNSSISNLYIDKHNTSFSTKYTEELKRFVRYNESSNSCLQWIAVSGKSSNVRVGESVGSLDKSDGYWKLHGLGFTYKVHRIIWFLHNGEIPVGKFIDHINGNRSDNRIENLRVVSTELNSRNRKMNKNNKTGYNMVNYQETYSLKGTLIRKYVVYVYLETWKKSSKSFSCLKYGDDEALRMAIDWRDKHLGNLKDKGFGYTERHGT